MYDKFLVLRAFLCIVVVAAHLPIIPLKLELFGVNLSWINTFDGHTMVVVFMVLSGYLASKQFLSSKFTLTKSGILNFYKNRILRIIPIYYMVILAELILFRSEFLATNEGRIKIIESLVFWFDIDKLPNLSGLFWSLSVEMQFYLIAPIVFWILSKLPKQFNYLILTGLGLFALDISIRRFLVPRLEINQLRHFAIHFVPLSFGMLLSFVQSHLSKGFLGKYITPKFVNIWFWLYIPSLIISSNIITYTSFQIGKKSFDRVPFVGLILLVTGITIVLIDKFSYQSRNFQSTNKGVIGILEKLGLLSYPIYVVHGLVLSLSYYTLKYNYSLGVLRVFGLTLVFACLLYYLDHLFKRYFFDQNYKSKIQTPNE